MSPNVRRSSFALLQARLYASRRYLSYACAGAVVAALLAPAGAAVPLFVCTALGIVAALEQTPGRHAHLDRCEQSAPLFGRQLARAKALVPCTAAVAAVVAYTIVAGVRELHAAGVVGWIAAIGAVAATLVALSASLRSGWPRVLYVLGACAVSAAAYALAVFVPYGVLIETALCALAAFVALRQYGETLARYDPV